MPIEAAQPLKRPRTPSSTHAWRTAAASGIRARLLLATRRVRSTSNGYDASDPDIPARPPTARLWSCGGQPSGASAELYCAYEANCTPPYTTYMSEPGTLPFHSARTPSRRTMAAAAANGASGRCGCCVLEVICKRILTVSRGAVVQRATRPEREPAKRLSRT